MTARRLALVPAALAALTAASFAIGWRRAGLLIPEITRWLEENYPETETP